MSKLEACDKAKQAADKIMKLLEEEKLTLAEITDVPVELERRINKNISKLKKDTVFKCLP